MITAVLAASIALLSASAAHTASFVAACVVPVVATAARRRTTLSWPTIALVAGVAWAIGLGRLIEGRTLPDTSVTGPALELIGFATIAGALGVFTRRRRGIHASGVLADALIVGLGTWLIAWVTIVEPMLGDDGRWPVITGLVDGLTHPTGAVALFLVAVYLFTEGTANVSVRLVGAGLGTLLAAHVLSSLAMAGQFGAAAPRIADAVFVVACAVVAVAFTHPSMATVEQGRSSSSAPRLLGRLVLTTSALVLPVIVLAASGPDDTTDRIVRSLSATVLAGAVTVRVVWSVRANSSAQAELLRAAQTDPLTGLPNRVLLLDRISSYVHESWRADREPTLYFVDLDRFKNINDSLGHSAGDEVLRIVAERLVSAAPTEAMVARLSGDEYVVLDPTTRSLAAASALAERLLAVFREPIALAQGDVFVTASIGVSSIDSMAAKPEDVLRHADTAMYRAKDSGRNCMAFYDESMHERIAHRLAVETALYRALDRHELRLFHQPILDLETGEVVGFEALMRWQQSDGTIVSPAEFIPIAEETGTIVPIGAWALLEALTQLRRWIDDGVCSPQATMSVNVSPRQLADPGLPSVVSEALSRSGMDASHLWIEITESVMISEPTLALASLQKMKALGVRVALDDFGTGYSSLSLLQRFPLQRIKIDRAFVQGVADNPSDRALVRTIVAMGQSLGLDMVAEGVESLHQIQVLHELGCRKAQGYLISHPVPADAMRSTVSALERIGRFPLLRGDHRAGQL
ncbi:MAG: EAL domain-containing protein [Acidimicrobiales bacterium]|nr:EAL domain-containing protein [Acidimicrobiales bacterium]MCB9394143.1 EAL domain-containing protein [Acidimicrobiaceae bacterium]